MTRLTAAGLKPRPIDGRSPFHGTPENGFHDMKFEQSGDDAVSAEKTITPETLIDLIEITYPRNVVQVIGIASHVKPWKDYFVYGRLSLGRSSIRFKTPKEFAPHDSEPVIIQGTVSIRQTFKNDIVNWRTTHEVMLHGKVIGNWTPRGEIREPRKELPKKIGRRPLHDFLSEYSMTQLTVLSTEISKEDITCSLRAARVDQVPHFVRANFGNADAFLMTLGEEGHRPDVAGIVISRGGEPGPDDVGNSRSVCEALIGLNKPFYSAMGHAKHFLLIDRVCDQAFHSPSEFGAATGRAVYANRKQESTIRELSDLKGKMSRLMSLHKQGISISWTTVIGAILVAACWFWFSHPFVRVSLDSFLPSWR